jgi:hypothetical protein
VNGALKAAWALTAFVIIAGAVLWAISGRAVFAVFIGLGVLTAVGAVVTGRTQAQGDPKSASEAAPKKEAP